MGNQLGPDEDLERRAGMRRRNRRIAGSVLGLLLAGAIGTYAYVRIDFVRHESRYDDLLNEARELGIPTSPQEVRQMYAVSESDNAAPIYRAAAAMAKDDSLNSWTLDYNVFVSATKGNRESLRLLEKQVSAVAPILAVVDRAALKSGCDFLYDWSQVGSVPMDEGYFFKQAVRWLGARAFLASLKGEHARATKDLRTAFRVAGHAPNGPLLVQQLVAMNIEGQALSAISLCAPNFVANPGSLVELKSLIDELAPLPTVTDCARQEAFFIIWISMNLRAAYRLWEEQRKLEEESSGGNEFLMSDWTALKKKWLAFPPLIEPEMVERANASATLGIYVSTLRETKSSPTGELQSGDQIDRLLRNFARQLKPWFVVQAQMDELFGPIDSAIVSARMKRSCTVALIEVLQFRYSHGRLPATLDEAGVKILDPFDGKPIKYRLVESGFDVYCAGENSRDDGGASDDRPIVRCRL